MFFWYTAFWSSFRVTLDLGEAHARRSKFESVFPGGRNPEGGAPGRRNLGRNSPEGRIRVRVFKKSTDHELSLLIIVDSGIRVPVGLSFTRPVTTHEMIAAPVTST